MKMANIIQIITTNDFNKLGHISNGSHFVYDL